MFRVLLTSTLAALIACEAAPKSRAPAAQQAGSLISDQVHNAGTAGFYFLPPMVAQPAVDGAFDAAVAATVTVSGPSGVIATFSTSDGSVAVTDHYEVAWHTGQYNLDTSVPYRITVSSGGKDMGIADVLLFPNMGKAKNVNTNDDIALVDGQTLPIKFWMNQCAPVVCGVCEVANSCNAGTGACTPLAAGTLCRASAGVCDAPEFCDGASGACPADAKLDATNVCGTAQGECDVAATCDGAGNDCPANHAAAAGTACSSDGNYCTADICDGSSISCTHPEAAGVCARDWGQYPSVAEVDTNAAEMFVMSDIHGDYWAYTNLLSQEGVISAIPLAPVLPGVQYAPCTAGQADCDSAHGALGIWNAGNNVMVVVGDLINKGPDSVDVIRLTMALQQSAAAAGGHVVVTLGNHEAEFLGDQGGTGSKAADNTSAAVHGLDPELAALFNGSWLGYVFNDGDADGDDTGLAGTQFTPALTASGNNDVGAWIHALPFAARVNDFFFVHGGNTHGRSIDEIRLNVQSTLDSRGWTGKDGALTTDATSTQYSSSLVYDPSNTTAQPFLAGQGSMLEARLQKSPLKTQWWDPDPAATGCTASANASNTLTQYVTALGVKHIVMGHQPGLVVFQDGTTSRAADTINRYPNDNSPSCSGVTKSLIFFVDMGMSQGNDSTGGGLLHITNPGSATEAWQRWVPSIPALKYGAKPATTTVAHKDTF